MRSDQRDIKTERIVAFSLLVGCLVCGFLRSEGSARCGVSSLKTEGGPFRPHMAQDIAVDTEGSVFVTGYGRSKKGDYDFITIKYDARGNLIWSKRYDGPANSSDYAQAVALDQHGHVYVAGHSSGLATSLDAALVKYDQGGQELWVARYDGPFHRDDWAYDLDCDDQGSIIVTGYSFGQGTEHDWLILKYGSDGRLLWKTVYNSPLNRDDMCRALALDNKGNIFLTGIGRTRKTSYDMTTLKYDAEGGLTWMARYAGPEGAFDAGEAVGVDSSGNACVTGYGYTMETEDDLVVVSYDADGRERWAVRYDGPAHRIDRGLGLVVFPGGGVCVTGTSCGLDGGMDSLTIRYDSNGNQVWSATHSGEGNGADVTHAIALDPESNIIVAGHSLGQDSGRDYLVIKYDAQGRQIWAERYDGPVHQEDAATSMTVDQKGNVYVTGCSQGGEANFDFATLKYSPDGRLEWAARYQSD